MKKTVAGILIGTLLISIVFVGTHLDFLKSDAFSEKVTIAEDTTEQNLCISFVNSTDSFFYIPLEQGNYKGVTCYGIENVTIKIDGISMNLEDALMEGYISVDEIIAYAHQDASLGLCNEVAKSKNGLTEFTYYYQEFRLRYIYDLYETPDGRAHLVTGCLIYGIGFDPHFLPEIDDETGKRIDYEDWGLLFEVSKLEPDVITVKCSQSGGQQMGALIVEDSILYKKNPNTLDLELVQLLTEEWSESVYWKSTPNRFLTMDGTKELVFDFSQLYGQLCTGDYVLHLQILDLYNEDDVHTLMRNYYDEQWYEITFTIE